MNVSFSYKMSGNGKKKIRIHAVDPYKRNAYSGSKYSISRYIYFQGIIVKTAQIRNGPGQNGPNPKRPSPKRPNFFSQNGPTFFYRKWVLFPNFRIFFQRPYTPAPLPPYCWNYFISLCHSLIISSWPLNSYVP